MFKVYLKIYNSVTSDSRPDDGVADLSHQKYLEQCSPDQIADIRATLFHATLAAFTAL